MVPSVSVILLLGFAGEGVKARLRTFRALLRSSAPSGDWVELPFTHTGFPLRVARQVLSLFFCIGSMSTLAQGLKAQLPPGLVSDHRSQYLVRSWQVEDGAPRHSVRSLYQTKSGYLW